MNRTSASFVAATTLFGLSSVAFAADLASSLRGPVVVPAASESSSSSGWYLRGDIGLDVAPNVETDAFEDGLEKTTSNSRLARTPFVAVGVGYQFTDYLRGDVTAEYRGRRNYSTKAHYIGGNGTTYNTNGYEGDLTTAVFLANAYVDLGHYSGFTPYVGAGVGTAYHSVSSLHEVSHYTTISTGADGTPNSGVVPGGTKWSFAWALHGGFSYDLAQNLKLDVGYSYKDLGKAKAHGSANCLYPPCGYEKIDLKRIAANDVHVGLRWYLDTPKSTPVYRSPVVAKF